MEQVKELAQKKKNCLAASPTKDVWGRQSHAENNNYRNLKWTFEIRCHVIVTQQTAIVEQLAR